MTKFNFILFLSFTSLSRLILLSFALFEDQINFNALNFLQTISLGLVSDVITFFYIITFLSFIGLLIPNAARNSKVFRFLAYIMYFILVMALCFLIASEFTFWLEFSTRFNFIAVDYLIYTHEVIRNIIESYPIVKILVLLTLSSSFIYWKIHPTLRLNLYIQKTFKLKLLEFTFFSLASALSFFLYNPKITEIANNNYLSEISKNGLYNLFSAFRHNSIEYPDFYQIKDKKEAVEELFEYIKERNHGINSQNLSRLIQASGPKHDYNVFLIPIESLSAEYFTIKYEDKPITPVLNALIKKSMYFSKVYATGTRTIRGLEAITLSTPPIPGQSIIRRENNENLFSIASILKQESYDIKFIYGGYGYFDNMNYFFSKNNFQIIDRNTIPQNEISFSNAWGIADEDLYAQAIKQADASFASNKKFFSLIMTTSNHRPYTYPDGKIDIPSKSNRQGGVKYSDYALGEFLKAAKDKPWFDNTIFVITADHCAGSAGKIALPPHKYHIPLIIYAPKIIKPQIINKMISQIDISPTILGLLNISYESRFFGNDALNKNYQNAFISTFQKLGYIENGKLIVLFPGKTSKTYNLLEDDKIIETIQDNKLINRAIDYYQSAYYFYQDGRLRQDAKN
jgi:phosphoglycerol transferase MdoB-like AlkP superfamily enzyme